MKRRTGLAFVLATVIGAVGGSALAHDFRLIRQGVRPADAVILEHGVGGARAFTLRAGETVALVVHDVNTPKPCKAKITVAQATGTSATITPNGSKGFVKDQLFLITGKTLGETTFRITVDGEASGGGRAECNEVSNNDVTVTVLPDDKAAEAQAAEIAKQLNKGLRTFLTTASNALKTELGGLRAEIRSGTVPPPLGACQFLEAYYEAMRDASKQRRTVVADFRTQLDSIVTVGGFTPDDEPRGFQPGFRSGVWTTGVRSIGSQIRAFDGKLRDGLAMDIGKLEKTYDSESRPLRVNYECCCCSCCCCCCDGPYPTTAVFFDAPHVARIPLALGMIGAISTLDSLGDPAGLLWIIGHGDSAKTQVQIDLTRGDGVGSSKTATIAADGTFRVDFDKLATGFAYKIELHYPGETMSYQIEKRIIGMPYIHY